MQPDDAPPPKAAPSEARRRWQRSGWIVKRQLALKASEAQKKKWQRWYRQQVAIMFVIFLVTAHVGAGIFFATEHNHEIAVANQLLSELNSHRSHAGLDPKPHPSQEAAAHGDSGTEPLPPPGHSGAAKGGGENGGQDRRLSESESTVNASNSSCVNASYYEPLLEYYEDRLNRRRGGGGRWRKQLETDIDDLRWTWPGSLFYAMTLMTTVGYGTFAPDTAAGKAMTVIFGFLGILVASICLGTFTAALDDWMTGLWRHNAASPRALIYRKYTLTVSLLVVQCLILAAFGSGIESWPYSEAIYFSFVTVSTIGLGDYAIRDTTTAYVIAQFAVIFPGYVLFAQFTNLSIELARLAKTELSVSPESGPPAALYAAHQGVEPRRTARGVVETAVGWLRRAHEPSPRPRRAFVPGARRPGGQAARGGGRAAS